MTSDAQLLQATLCFLADRMGADHPDTWVARAVLSATRGPRPTQAGVDALCYVADEQRHFEDVVLADLATL
jgi:hypothetical protein